MPSDDCIFAPWSDDTVQRLNRYQSLGYLHPFTCRDRDHSGNDILVATREGWKYPTCGLVQPWAYKIMLRDYPEVYPRLTTPTESDRMEEK